MSDPSTPFSVLPALLVLIPAVAAVAVALLGRLWARAARWTALAATAAQAVLALALFRAVARSGSVRAVLGGFPALAGVELVVDRLAVPFVVLVAAIGLLVVAVTTTTERAGSFLALVLLLVAGLTGVFVTGDAFNLYVFLELAGLSSYALVATADTDVAAGAALRYLLVGTVGAALYLLGVGYAYVATGALNVSLLGQRLGAGTPAIAAFALVAVGLGVKVPVVPLHGWLPDAHGEAPVGVSVLLSGLVTTAGAYALARLVLAAFGIEFLAAVPLARVAVVAVGATSVVVGGLLALRQSKVKRLLACSTVSQLGLVVLGVGLANRLALTGAVVHLLSHAALKTGAFLAAGAIAESTGAKTVREYAGVARRAPLASAALAAAALGLVGVPPAGVFASKWYLVVGTLTADAPALAALVVASSLLSLLYFWRVLERLVAPGDAGADSHPPHATDGSGARAPTGTAVAAAIAVLAGVLLGFVAAPLETFLEPTLTALLE
ncbi:complex I subunit 5 family protein [Halomicrococcus sp. SG-WS-1]|uniref:complex I subunit 5 family protein n=1 Tax=Halomicrococcus sp. SG-WS-1 TaxID=3439057 RepID=UPI003F7A6CDC